MRWQVYFQILPVAIVVSLLYLGYHNLGSKGKLILLHLYSLYDMYILSANLAEQVVAERN
jgi:hypothetical protein